MKISASIFGAYALAVIAHYYFALNFYTPGQTLRTNSDALPASTRASHCSDKDLRTALIALDHKIATNRTYIGERFDELSANIYARGAQQHQKPVAQIEKVDNGELEQASHRVALHVQDVREETIVTLDEQMLAEKENLQWEIQAKDDINGFFTKLGDNAPKLDDSYCSGNICRLEISYSNEQQLGLVFDEEHSLVPWPHKGKTFNISGSGDRKRQLIYLINTEPG